MDAPYPALVSNTPFVKGRDYDTSAVLSEATTISENVITRSFTKKSSNLNIVPVIVGPRDDLLESQTSSY
jgi:hypothetical protein